MLAELYRSRFGSGFEAYMALQRALLAHWVARGGTEEAWCSTMASLFRQRYAVLVDVENR